MDPTLKWAPDVNDAIPKLQQTNWMGAVPRGDLVGTEPGCWNANYGRLENDMREVLC